MAVMRGCALHTVLARAVATDPASDASAPAVCWLAAKAATAYQAKCSRATPPAQNPRPAGAQGYCLWTRRLH